MLRLKIAFISYEYPPDIGQGGIATYIGQIASAMVSLEHHVEIFSGSYQRECSENYKGVLTHRILCKSPDEFRANVVDKFKERHHLVGFDVFECAEINADGAKAKDAFPDLPLVVKLHAPTYLLINLLNFYTPSFRKLRFLIGNLRRGVWRPWGKPDLTRDKDFLFTSKADLVLSPSLSLKDIIVKDWKIPEHKIKVIPNPYEPAESALAIPVSKEDKKPINILFIGKLNIQKGVLNLAKAIPGVVKTYKDVNFIFVGNDGPSPLEDKSMRSYLEGVLKGFNNIHFKGAISLEEVPDYLADADICVVPSLWENFPYVCLEAMSAGRAVIGSNKGGMSEMLANDAGVLIDPTSYKQIEEAIKFLIQNPGLRREMGKSARTKVLRQYNLNKIGKEMEKAYAEAISFKAIGPKVINL
ncbi:glycosyltransferase family 4 protein [Pontibacter pamirensis]|uniref:glycosyltransferase family 4 protein n=1 Tax=Pontibacter pamirensis TaxID=2562824 RepID=UPI001389E3F0|nr:glycosyltransferase family 4 protein [Pontibacter pamirensis]